VPKTKIQKELVCSFFRTFLFEGTENIKRGEWFKIVTGNGGTNNANTTEDRTYYYEVPSNNLELGLWMESERMLHPVIKLVLIPKTRLKKKRLRLTTVLMDKSFLR
jgi:predicted Zn-dependent peptidase